MTKIPSSSNSRLFWIAAVGVVVFVYFFGLTIPLVGPDEPRYSQVAREMFERGDWVTPTLGGFNWFEKPALLYWLQIVSYNLFGVSEFSARFGSALFGLGTIAALWMVGRRVEKLEYPRVEFANWLALIAASSIGLIVFSRGASFDIILTFPITAAMACFFVYDLTQIPKDTGHAAKQHSAFRIFLPLFGFYFFIGIGLLAKGLIGAVFPFAIAAFYFLISRRLPSRAFFLSLVWGAAVALAVAATWYLPMYTRHGWEFIDEFFVQHHFQRYTSNKYLHPQPFYFFLWVLPLMTIPWLPFFLAAVWKFSKGAIYRRDSEAQIKGTIVADQFEKADRTDGTEDESQVSPRIPASSTPLLLFSTAWLLVPLVFFSFSGSKLPGYILPAVPPAIIITSLYLMEFVRSGERRAALVKALAMATFVVVVGIIIFALPRFAYMDSVKGLIEAANHGGYRAEKVLTLHTVSHNAEFYAAGRLVRDDKGRQKRLLGPAEVLQEIRKTDSGGALVIVPLEYKQQLADSPLLASDVIADNTELVIAYVRQR
jgi:4-amino-4-deoxy-L-arabinose transferase-like glycosyltransferase